MLDTSYTRDDFVAQNIDLFFKKAKKTLCGQTIYYNHMGICIDNLDRLLRMQFPKRGITSYKIIEGMGKLSFFGHYFCFKDGFSMVSYKTFWFILSSFVNNHPNPNFFDDVIDLLEELKFLRHKDEDSYVNSTVR